MSHDHVVQCLHDPLLVALSYLVSALGSFAALQLAIAIPIARGAWARWRAIAAAGAIMGGGAIWAMHFIAMLACRMDLSVSYDPGMTAASAAVAMGACMLGLALAGSGVSGRMRLAAAGTIMGLGVAGMHYAGMAAMRMAATIHYDPGLVVASVAVAVVASTASLWLAFNLRGQAQRLGSALVMGLAVCGMHYTGMLAATFVPVGMHADAGDGLGSADLAFGLVLVSVVMLAVVRATGSVRQRQRAAVRI